MPSTHKVWIALLCLVGPGVADRGATAQQAVGGQFKDCANGCPVMVVPKSPRTACDAQFA